MLTVSHLTKSFGGLTAVDDVEFEIGEEEIVGLIGPNGAGKSTLFNTITGVYRADEGSVIFNGQELTGQKPHQIAKEGIARTFQTARTFNESTVLENVVIGVVFGHDESIPVDEARERSVRYLEFVGLSDKKEVEVSNLTIADRKQLELAKGLAAEPDLILVDEIASGLTPTEVDELVDTLERVRSELGISVLWIEHIMGAIMGATDRIIVLNQGQKIAEGTPAQIQRNDTVAEAYLGGEA